MKTNVKTIRSLNYLAAFSCIGGTCEDNCCIGWDVDIDLKTYQKYQKVTDPELKKLYKTKIQPYPYFFSEDVDYARVTLGKNKRCPFLNEQGLCKTQAKLGETYLSNVCATYPRMSNEIDGVLENTLTLSCPEAARLVLLNPDGLSWVENTSQPPRVIVNMNIQTTSPQYKKHPVKHFHALREMSVLLLSDRSYPIWERLLHLGEVFEVLSEAHEHKKVNTFPEILSHFKLVQEQETWAKPLSISPLEGAATQLHRVDDLIARLKVFSEIDSQKFVAYTKNLQAAFEFDPKTKKSKPSAYLSLHDQNYQLFEAEHGYILENYLINFVYKNLFPFTESENLFEAYTMLALRFVMIRTYLVAISGVTGKGLGTKEDLNTTSEPRFETGLKPEQAVAFIQSFAKAIEHHKNFSENTLAVLRGQQLNNLRYLEALLVE
jgi:lysine-N-methylase